MNPPQTSQDLYLHVRVVISIIVGLCITTLLDGFARFVQHGQWHPLVPSEAAFAQRGSIHTFRNLGKTVGCLMGWVRINRR